MSLEAWIADNLSDFQSWLRVQRWFGDKSKDFDTVEVLRVAVIVLDGHEVELMAVNACFTDGSQSNYFAPLCVEPDGRLRDATELPSFLRWIGSGFEERRVIPADRQFGGVITWMPSGSGLPRSWSSESPKLLSGEQSNTSVLFASQAIAKIFRKLQPGLNPDSEVTAYISEQGAFSHTPGFLGSIRLDTGDSGTGIELVSAQSFVPNSGDSWRWLPPVLAGAAEEDLPALLPQIALLGQRTGELHVALGQPSDQEAFSPEPFERTEVEAVEERLGREVRLTTAMLHQHGAISYVESEDLASALLGDVSQADVLLGTYRTRVHGDYHLGQVLRTDDDFVIIDFEGEPSRSIRERREKHSPLKDVAGMLRSIDYAVATATSSATVDALTLREWGIQAENAFLKSYRQAVSTSSLPLVPRDDQQFSAALDLFMIEKALYEVRYEMDNRPDWLDIPLGALQRIGQR